MNKRVFHQAAAKILRKSGEQFSRMALAVEARSYLSGIEKRLLSENRQYEDLYKGRRAFVLGNGPSLDKVDLTLLKDELVFVVNGFACHRILDVWQPVALTLADPSYFERPEIYQSEFKLMRERLKACLYFVPLRYRDVILQHDLLPMDRCRFIHIAGNMAYHRKFALDITRPIPGGQTVTLAAILISLYMGCNPVYLLGVDHDFLATPSKPTHFAGGYEANVSKQEKQAISFQSWGYLKLIKAVDLMFEGYVNLGNMAAAENRRIFNATPGGFLDVFERVELNDILSRGP